MKGELPVTRREFLNYVWAASIALCMAGSGGMTFWFAMPRHKVGIDVDVDDLPASGQPPMVVLTDMLPNPYSNTKVATSNSILIIQLQEGLMALDRRCTHLGCVMPFSVERKRFDCPCHGSQYTPMGVYIAGPSPRDMDRYRWQALDSSGTVLAQSPRGEPLHVPTGTRQIRISTDELIPGKSSNL